MVTYAFLTKDDIEIYEDALDADEGAGVIDTETWCSLMTRFLRTFADRPILYKK
jgi:hypothetical protein